MTIAPENLKSLTSCLLVTGTPSSVRGTPSDTTLIGYLSGAEPDSQVQRISDTLQRELQHRLSWSYIHVIVAYLLVLINHFPSKICICVHHAHFPVHRFRPQPLSTTPLAFCHGHATHYNSDTSHHALDSLSCFEFIRTSQKSPHHCASESSSPPSLLYRNHAYIFRPHDLMTSSSMHHDSPWSSSST